MAIIYTYPTSTPTTEDLLIGTDITGKETKNFTIEAIANLVSQNSGSSVYTTRVVELTPTQILSLNGNGVLELIPAPGAGKVIIVSEILLFLDYNSTAYNFNPSSGSLKTAFGTSTPVSNIDYRTSLNKSSDYYVSVPELMEPKVNQPLNLLGTGGISVTQGNSTVKFSIVYRIVNSTTLL